MGGYDFLVDTILPSWQNKIGKNVLIKGNKMKYTLGRIEDFVFHNGVLSCNSADGKLEITFLNGQMLYIRYDFKGLEIPESLEKANMILKGTPSVSESCPAIELKEDYAHVKTGEVEIYISRTDGNLDIRYKGERVFGGQLGTSDTVIPRTQTRAFKAAGDTSWFARINNPLDDDDRIFGVGDKSGRPDRKGKRVRFYNRDSLGYDGETSDPLYKAIPFYLTQNTRNNTITGLYYPESLINVMDFGEESPFYSYVEINNGPISFYVIPGDDYSSVIRKYCTITGFPAFPPLFSFGFFGSSMNYVESDNASERILTYFKQTEDHEIPCEGMYVSSGYLKAPDDKRYAFFWNTKKFPDYGNYLSKLHDRGYNLMMNIKPGFLTTHPWYEELKQKGFFLKGNDGQPLVEYFWGGDASFLDFSNPDAKNWWKDQLKDKYFSHGCTGIWNDNNECELEDPDTDAYRTKLLYPMLMSQAAFEAANEFEPGKRHWNYSRSLCPGSQKYARSWTGDNTSTWKTLRFNQYQILSLGLCAFPYIGNDLGGFFGDVPTMELLVRSCQSAVFQPRFVIHSWRADDKPTEPWTYPTALPLIRNLVLEHYRFIPYIYNAAYQASQTGKPINRILALEYPDDKDIPSDYPFFQSGDSIISLFTVDQDQNEVNIHMPQGTEWYDPKTGGKYLGGQNITIRIELGEPRYLFKIPSIIPTSPECTNLMNGHFRNLDFFIVPGTGDYEYDYFEDDGNASLDSERYSIVNISIHAGKISIRTKKGSIPTEGRFFTATLAEGYVFSKNHLNSMKLEMGKDIIELEFRKEK